MGLLLVLMIFNGVSHTSVGHGLLLSVPCNASVMRITTYSLGCSLVAMFNRVAGGNYTKAADISSDILGKIRHDLPEDDARVPNTIADFIGDNVNDIAGNCSDLLESYVASIAAGLMISVTSYETAVILKETNITEATFNATTLFPVTLAGVGLFSCLLSIMFTSLRNMKDDPEHELDLSNWIAAGLTVALSFCTCMFLFKDVPLYDEFRLGWISPWISALLGIASGVAIGSITEYYTSTDYKPARQLAEIATEGEAFVITKGDALGSRSSAADSDHRYLSVLIRRTLRYIRHCHFRIGHAVIRRRNRLHRCLWPDCRQCRRLCRKLPPGSGSTCHHG
jgi:K(+)-stimulated pyrophosphate-energized sodium pump